MPTTPPRPAEILDVLRVEDFAPDQFFLDGTKKIRLSGAAVSETHTYVAGAAVSGQKALMFNPDGSGTVVQADPTQQGYVYAGVSLGAAQMGQPVLTADEGPMSAPFWTWTFGKPVFTAPGGNLTQVEPEVGISHVVAFATGVNSLLLSDEGIIVLE